MKDAAAAKTALQDMASAVKAESAAEVAGSTAAASARQKDIVAIQQEAQALSQLANAARATNVQLLYGGRNDMTQHLSDLSQELTYTTLLNRQRWLGFSSVQQAVSYRQQMYQLALLENKAHFAGYLTADQYIGFLQRETASTAALSAVIRDRTSAIATETAALLAHANALQGTRQSAGTLGEQLTVSATYSATLAGLPSVVTTSAYLDVSKAIASAAEYHRVLASLPAEVRTNVFAATTPLSGLPLPSAATTTPRYTGVPRYTATPASFTGAPGDLAAEMRALASATQQLSPGIAVSSSLVDRLGNSAQLAAVDIRALEEGVSRLDAALLLLGETRSRAAGAVLQDIIQAAEAGNISNAPHGYPALAPVQFVASERLQLEGADEVTNQIREIAREAEDAGNEFSYLDEMLSMFGRQRVHPEIDFSRVEAARQSAEELAAEMAALDHEPVEIDVELNDAGALAELEVLQGRVLTAEEQGRALMSLLGQGGAAGGGGGGGPPPPPPPPAAGAAAPGEPNPEDLAALARALNTVDAVMKTAAVDTRGAAASMKDLKVAYDDATRSLGAGAAPLIGAASGWAGLGTKVALFGGVLNGMLGTISVWHILLDAVIETLALWVPAIGAVVIGLGAFFVAANLAQDSLGRIADRAKATYTAAYALNQQLPGINDNFSKLATTVRPDTWQLLGDALIVVNHNGGTFNQIITQTGKVLDDLGAKLTTFLTSNSKGLQDFFQAGAKDAHLIAVGLEDIGVIFLNLVKVTEQTHIAQDLATIGDAVLGIVKDISQLPTPLLAVLIGLHGFIVWGGLFSSIILEGINQVVLFAGKIGVLNDAALVAAASLGATNDQLIKLGESSPAVQAVTEAMAASGVKAENLATQISTVQVAAVKSGTAIEDFGSESLRAASLFETYSAGLDDAGVKTVALGVKSGASEVALAALNAELLTAGHGVSETATAVEDAGKVAEESAGRFSKFGSAVGGAASGLGNGLLGLTGLDTALAPLAGALGITTGALAAFGVAAAAAGVVLGLIIDKIVTSRTEVQQWGDSLQKAVAAASTPMTGFATIFNNFIAIQQKVTAATDQYNSAQQNVTAATKHYQDELAKVTSTGKTAGDMLKNMNAQASGGGPAVDKARQALLNYERQAMDTGSTLSQLHQVLQQQVTDFNDVTQFAGTLSHEYGTNFTESLGLAATANVNMNQILAGPSSKAWAQALLQVQALTTAYKEMGQQAGVLGQDIDAQIVANSDQLASMQKVNTAFDTWTKIAEGPLTAFESLNQALMTFGGAQRNAAANFNTLNAASSTLRGDFQQVLPAVESLFDAFRNAQAINGGQGNFVQFVKDAVASLIPLAHGNQAAAAEISQLAQEAGGPATTSLSQLSKWAGNVANPMEAMFKATQQATIATSNLSQEAASLTTSISSDIDSLIKNTVELNVITPLMTKYAQEVQTLGVNNKTTRQTAADLNNLLSAYEGPKAAADSIHLLTGAVTGNITATAKAPTALQAMQDALAKAHTPTTQLTGDLHGLLVAAVAYGTNSTQFHQASTQVTKDLTNAGVGASTAKTDLQNYITQVVDLATKSAAGQASRKTLTSDITSIIGLAPTAKNDLDALITNVSTLGSKASSSQGARTQLIKDLENAGLQAKDATNLVDGLIKAIGNVKSPAPIKFVATAGGTVTATEFGALLVAAGLTGTSATNLAAQLAFGAGGGAFDGNTVGSFSGSVPGAASHDNFHTMLMGGEYVVRQSARMALEAMFGRGFMDWLNQFDQHSSAGSRGTAASHSAGPGFGYASGGQAGFIQSFMTLPAWLEIQATNMQAGATDSWMKSLINSLNQLPAQAAARQAAAAAQAVASGGGGGAIEALMKSMAAARGWTGALWTDLFNVEMAEAGFNTAAVNPSSGAYGLAQFINGPGEYAQYGGSSTSAAGQITGMLNYIAQRYGSPAGAWAHEQAYHWYGGGGPVPKMASGGLAPAGPIGTIVPISQAPSTAAAYSMSVGPVQGNWQAAVNAFHALSAWNTQPKGVSAAAWKAYKSALGVIAQRESAAAADYRTLLTNLTKAPSTLTPALWSAADTDARRWQQALPPASLAAQYQAGDYDTMWTHLGVLQQEIINSANIWENVYNTSRSGSTGTGSTSSGSGSTGTGSTSSGSGSTGTGSTSPPPPPLGIGTPGIRSTGPGPSGSGSVIVDLSQFINSVPRGGIGGYGFNVASGGLVPPVPSPVSLSSVAAMFGGGMASGGLVPSLVLPGLSPALTRQLSAAASSQLPRTMSEAASGARGGLHVDQLTINNPKPERPSDSITRASNRLAFLAGRGMV